MVLEHNMAAIEADEELQRGNVPDHRVYDLVLAATGSKDRAGQALQNLIARRNRENVRAEV